LCISPYSSELKHMPWSWQPYRCCPSTWNRNVDPHLAHLNANPCILVIHSPLILICHRFVCLFPLTCKSISCGSSRIAEGNVLELLQWNTIPYWVNIHVQNRNWILKRNSLFLTRHFHYCLYVCRLVIDIELVNIT
jgi:hypothetical protein